MNQRRDPGICILISALSDSDSGGLQVHCGQQSGSKVEIVTDIYDKNLTIQIKYFLVQINAKLKSYVVYKAELNMDPSL